MARHQCWQLGNNGNGWHVCPICEGRIHIQGCTSRPNRLRDCCAARHKMLFDQGHIVGLCDSSFIMWTPEHPEGIHRNEV